MTSNGYELAFFQSELCLKKGCGRFQCILHKRKECFDWQ